MATRTVVDCDKCGLETANPIHIAIPNGVDKESGCPSLEIYTHYDERDLCPGCAEKAFRALLGTSLVAGSVAEADKTLLRWFGIKERT